VFDLPTAAPVLAAAVGLTGSVVAGLSVYLSYRGRHNLIRQVVYGRQLDAYFDIAAAMTALYTAAENALAAVGHRLTNEDAPARVRAALRDEHERFTEAVNRSLIVLPSRVKSAVDQSTKPCWPHASRSRTDNPSAPPPTPRGSPGRMNGC
jgi:hypothetical protein